MAELWLDGYTKKVYGGRTGKVPRRPDAPARICLHFTVTSGLPNYSWPPHFTVGTAGKWQHCDLNRTSYALRASPYVETNHMGDTNIQIEVIARDDNWSDKLYEVVSETLADIVRAKPGMRVALLNHDRTVWQRGGYGVDGPWRLTDTGWVDPYDGEPFIYAHMHVPDNTHWDTGHADIVRLTGRALELLDGTGASPLPPPGWPTLVRAGDRSAWVRLMQDGLILLGHLDDGDSDGVFGPVTAAAVRRFQEIEGVTVDGIFGPVTRARLGDALKALYE